MCPDICFPETKCIHALPSRHIALIVYPKLQIIKKLQRGPIHLVKSCIHKDINECEFVFLPSCLAFYGLKSFHCSLELLWINLWSFYLMHLKSTWRKNARHFNPTLLLRKYCGRVLNQKVLVNLLHHRFLYLKKEIQEGKLTHCNIIIIS